MDSSRQLTSKKAKMAPGKSGKATPASQPTVSPDEQKAKDDAANTAVLSASGFSAAEATVDGLTFKDLLSMMRMVVREENSCSEKRIVATIQKDQDKITKDLNALKKKVTKNEQQINKNRKEYLAEKQAEKEVVIHGLIISEEMSEEDRDELILKELQGVDDELKDHEIDTCYVPNLKDDETPKAVITLMDTHVRQRILRKYKKAINQGKTPRKVTAGKTKKERDEGSKRYGLFKECEEKNQKSRGNVYYRVGKKKPGEALSIISVKQGEEGFQDLKDSWLAKNK